MRLEIEMTDTHLLLVHNDSHSRHTLVGYFQSETGITFHTAPATRTDAALRWPGC